jgi:hypothetical protein
MSESSMVEIVESDMDVVKLNKFDLKVFGSGRNIYCVEMELLPVLIGIFPSQTEILGHNHHHVACCRKALSEEFVMGKYLKDQSVLKKTRQLLKKAVKCVPLNLISKYLDTAKMVTSMDEIEELNALLKQLYKSETARQDQESSDFWLHQGQMTQASLKKDMNCVY